MDFQKCPRCKCHRSYPQEFQNIKGRVIKTCIKCRSFASKYRLNTKSLNNLQIK